MAAREDDDALTWEGDDDTSAHGSPSLPSGYRAVGRGSDRYADGGEPRPQAHASRADAVAADEDADAATPGSEPSPGMGNATLVSLGVIAGIYLLFSVGWLIGGDRLNLVAQLFLEPIGFTVAWVLTIAAPTIWFVTVMLLTRASRPWVRIVALIAGAIVLVPWPFLMTGLTA